MKQPNILIVMTDHQRWDTILKDDPCITPNTDKYLEDSINFTNTYCPMAHCCPARATFHSGLSPQRTGIWNNVCNPQALQYDLNEGVRLWSEDLAVAGYDMGYVGKWHVNANDRPADRGWQPECPLFVRMLTHDIMC